MKLEEYEVGEILYNRERDENICKKFFVLLSGNVNVQIHNPNKSFKIK